MRRSQNKLVRIGMVVLVLLLCIGLMLPYFVTVFSY